VHLNLTASSTALFSTWIFVENFSLLFDAGDGVSATLGQKSRKIRHVFVTHADRDHVCGLLQLHQLNAAQGLPCIYYPEGCGSFPALRDFMQRFDPQSGPASWKGLKAGDRVDLEKGIFVTSAASPHVSVLNLTKALNFTLCSVRRVLKPEFCGLPGPEIVAKRHGLSFVLCQSRSACHGS
jgi:ribonuclease Z